MQLEIRLASCRINEPRRRSAKHRSAGQRRDGSSGQFSFERLSDQVQVKQFIARSEQTEAFLPDDVERQIVNDLPPDGVRNLEAVRSGHCVNHLGDEVGDGLLAPPRAVNAEFADDEVALLDLRPSLSDLRQRELQVAFERVFVTRVQPSNFTSSVTQDE
jgi:hypothetical protein